jgi:hypothetical protein
MKAIENKSIPVFVETDSWLLAPEFFAPRLTSPLPTRYPEQVVQTAPPKRSPSQEVLPGESGLRKKVLGPLA